MRPQALPGFVRQHLSATIGLAVLAFAVLWVIVGANVVEAFGSDPLTTLGGISSAANDPQTFISVVLNGITLAGIYFIVASGFTLIFGLMRIVNMAHGTLFLLGFYIAYELVNGGRICVVGCLPHTSGTTWVGALFISSAIVGVLGLVMQQVFLRWNQGQDLRQAIITIAISLVVADQMIEDYGGLAAKQLNIPKVFDTTFPIYAYGLQYPLFRAFVLGVAVFVGLLLFLIIKRTRFGMIVRAGVDDRAMVSTLGINIQLVFAAAFLAGSFLASLGGVFAGTAFSLGPGDDGKYLLSALIVVIIGGMGSLGGAAIGAIAYGLVDQLSSVYLPFEWSPYSIILTFVLLVFILVVRPLGLFGRPA